MCVLGAMVATMQYDSMTMEHGCGVHRTRVRKENDRERDKKKTCGIKRYKAVIIRVEIKLGSTYISTPTLEPCHRRDHPSSDKMDDVIWIWMVLERSGSREPQVEYELTT